MALLAFVACGWLTVWEALPWVVDFITLGCAVELVDTLTGTATGCAWVVSAHRAAYAFAAGVFFACAAMIFAWSHGVAAGCAWAVPAAPLVAELVFADTVAGAPLIVAEPVTEEPVGVEGVDGAADAELIVLHRM